MIPAGKYKARPICWGLSESKQGSEQFQIEFEIQDPNVAPSDRVWSWWGKFSSEKAEEISFKAMKACGWNGTDLEHVELDPTRDVELVIESETYEGKTRMRVQWVNAIGGGGIQYALPSDRARKFAERMKARAEKFQASAGPSKPAAPDTRQQSFRDDAQPEDEGVPF